LEHFLDGSLQKVHLLDHHKIRILNTTGLGYRLLNEGTYGGKKCSLSKSTNLIEPK
jgi:hypothetical protein